MRRHQYFVHWHLEGKSSVTGRYKFAYRRSFIDTLPSKILDMIIGDYRPHLLIKSIDNLSGCIKSFAACN